MMTSGVILETCNLSDQIKQNALQIGFDLVGIAPVTPHAHFPFFEEWLGLGYAATMEWLHRKMENRKDPAHILAEAKSLIVCGLNYHAGKPFSVESKDRKKGWISNYAWGDDYHEVVLEKLKKLETCIRQITPATRMKSYVDTGPILERSYANSAGLGWIGKNTCLIHPKKGSFFFIGEIITDLELIHDKPEPDHCGTCTRCLDACPTQALSPYTLNANLCISYLTIEHREDIAPDLQKKMGHQVVGCDICQDVCPWNKKIAITREKSFFPRADNFNPDLHVLQNLTEEEFSRRFKKSTIKRVKKSGLVRNARIALKNANSQPT